jgi:hypothetical protein
MNQSRLEEPSALLVLKVLRTFRKSASRLFPVSILMNISRLEEPSVLLVLKVLRTFRNSQSLRLFSHSWF